MTRTMMDPEFHQLRYPDRSGMALRGQSTDELMVLDCWLKKKEKLQLSTDGFGFLQSTARFPPTVTLEAVE